MHTAQTTRSLKQIAFMAMVVARFNVC